MRVFLFFLCTSSYICSSHAVSTFDFHQNTEIVGKTETVETVYEHTFIDLARSVYLNNDKRANIKSQINKILDSNIKDEYSCHTNQILDFNQWLCMDVYGII